MYRYVLLTLFISLGQYFAEKNLLFVHKHAIKGIFRNVLPVYVHVMKG